MKIVKETVENPEKLNRVIKLLNAISGLFISIGKFVSSFKGSKSTKNKPLEETNEEEIEANTMGYHLR